MSAISRCSRSRRARKKAPSASSGNTRLMIIPATGIRASPRLATARSVSRIGSRSGVSTNTKPVWSVSCSRRRARWKRRCRSSSGAASARARWSSPSSSRSSGSPSGLSRSRPGVRWPSTLPSCSVRRFCFNRPSLQAAISSGRLSSRRVWPVGAVSNTIRSKRSC